MSKHPRKPCAHWAEQLAQASFGHLSGEESAALKAHLIACPACAAVRADYLATAEILHQASDSDPLPGLPPSLLQVWAEEARHAPARHLTHFGHLQEVPMQTFDHEIPPAVPSQPPTWRQRVGRRTVTVMSAIAAVLVIALVTTALIASHAPGASSRTGSGQSATATSKTGQPSNQQWQALPHLANIPVSGWSWTGLAPSNPRIVYQISSNNQGTSVSLRRSDDQGATWKNLPAPEGAQENLPELYISPTNAQHVLALAQRACSSGQAATDALAVLSGGNSCSVVYFSKNGGESWAPVTLPARGSHNLFMGFGIFAQENRLYAILTVEPGVTASELVTSSDDGATWQFADQGLMADQHCLWGISGPATGTTLYTTTLSFCGGQVNGSDSAQIWRSDDAGAHWRTVGTMPGTDAYSMKAVNISGQSQPVLIYTDIPNTMRFSLDDGKTWQPVPALGNQGVSATLGILHDGSLLAQGSDGLYAWKAGDANWHKVAPTPGGRALDALVVFDQASGKETVYLEVLPDGTEAVSFYSITLA